MTVRSASGGLSALTPAEPQALATPSVKVPAVLARAPFTYRRAFVLSLLLHGLVLSALSLLGIGPRVALGNPWGSPGVDASAFTLVMAPASSGGGSFGETVIDPVERESPPVLPDTADTELAELELAELLSTLRELPLEPEAAPPPAAELGFLVAERRSESKPAGGAVTPSGDQAPAPLAAPDHPGTPQASQGSGGTGEQGDGQPSPLGLPDGTSGGYIPPSFADLTPPDYPHSARRLGHEGSALIRIHVSASGRVLDVELVESSGHELLDQTALSAARAWRFHPATQDGVPMAASLLHRVTFRLEER